MLGEVVRACVPPSASSHEVWKAMGQRMEHYREAAAACDQEQHPSSSVSSFICDDSEKIMSLVTL